MKKRYTLLLSLGLTVVFFLCAGIITFRAARVSAVQLAVPKVSPALVLTGEDSPDTPLKELLPGTVLNINTASAEELTALDGIGESLAAAIVEYRDANGPFSAPEDIMLVYGIGEKKFAAIRDYITTGDST